MDVKERLVALFAEALLAESDDIGTDVEIASLGVDSILAAQLGRLISHGFNIAVTPTDLYECVTIDGLAVHVGRCLADKWRQSGFGSDTPRGTVAVLGDEGLDDDRIVVVGMAARFAGCDGLDAYWDAIMDGASRLKVAERRGWHDDGGVYVGGFLTGHDSFDAGFFRISPNEARYMDPQQRLLMQSVQHAIDDSYLGADELRELQCGVFAASLPGDYKFVVARQPGQAFSTHSFLGNAASTLSGRISYFYDFNGPSLTLDTACSSSLSALHEACLNIQAGQCGAAVVAAASVFSTPELFRFAQRSGMSSPTGRCAAFSNDADGFTPAEGCAAIILMRLGEARVRGLRVYGAIAATGLNHDGKSNGLMAPNARSQSALIRGLYQRHGVNLDGLAYVETHGTGTHLGDPIEMRGLTGAFRDCGKDYTCLLGTVKPVIGHTLVCSGLASLIKVLLSFRHEAIPPFPLLGKPNELIDFAGFRMNPDPLPWPKDKTLCAVSAFGFTGSNGHVLLQKIPATMLEVPARPAGEALPFCFSAQSRNSLIASVMQLRDDIAALGKDVLYDVSQLLLRRPCYGLHCVVVAADMSGLRLALDQLVQELRAGDALRDVPLAMCGLSLSEAMVSLVTLWCAGKQEQVRSQLLPVASLDPDVRIPVYPFDGRRYWLDGDAQDEVADPVMRSLEPSSDALVETLRVAVAELLGFSRDELPVDVLIEDLGLDSLSALKLLSPYRERCPGLQAHDLFKYRTLADLGAAIVAYGVDDGAGGGTSPEVAPGRGSSPVVSGPMAQWLSYGEGRPIVLTPPLNTGAEAWTQQIAMLAQSGRRVLIPIYPGHKECPFDASTFSLEELAEDIAIFMGQQARNDAIDLVGWSLGGCLSCLIAINHPDLVRSLTLVSTAPSFNEDVFDNTLDLHDELNAHKDILEVVFDGAEDLIAKIGAGASMNVLRYYYNALVRFDINAGLGKISMPVLLAHGQDDCVIDDAAFSRLSCIPGASRLVVKGHGHFIPLTASRFFNTHLLRFLNREFVG
ncbi:alpha/beta fold hydrolase [Haematospirillum sp. 15-248]|uniref:alpha/beta fold hydrolase n=1 Tax=Haematospirillum sp. 15-248 TaxID=2723107 RepID=UPI00143A5872|nr:alpha/beta fold hydrolase [Haematospirillum sp. 15-248]NKD87404.1 alpha/beta fold hydrolase [Haematospirillum sp. 15-248]